MRSSAPLRVLCVLACTLALAAQQPRPLTIALIGASVTAGFTDPKPRADGEPNSTVRLAHALRDTFAGPGVRIRDRSDLATFLDPVGRQTRQVARLADEAPDLTIAVDFLFWFGYGRVGGDELEARLALLEQGLALLDQVEGPILVGDFPDMRGADPRMLRASQVPSPGALEALNRRLAAWASARARVRIFPLAAFVAAAKGEGIAVEHAAVRLQLGREALLQGDGLHATRLGVALIAERIAGELRELLPAEHPARPTGQTLADFAASTGAGPLLDELAAAAQPEPVGGGK
jgi:hypothetical protein